MKYNLLHLLTLCLLTLLPATIQAQKTDKKAENALKKEVKALAKVALLPANTNNRNSLLWEISGNELEHPSYLYGTMHIIGEKDYFMSDLVKDRFNHTVKLALEVDMDDPSIILSMMSGMMMADKTKLSDLLSEEDYQKVADYFSDNLGISLKMMERMKPILLTAMMAEEGMGGAQVSYETIFMGMAKEKNREILGLETAETQLAMLDSIPYTEQAKMLVDAIGDDENSELLDKMTELYKQQNIDALYQMTVEESSEIGNYEGPLLITRNKNWIPVIDTASRKYPTFFAVGAAHLGGKNGVIQLLIDAGFTVTPLTER